MLIGSAAISLLCSSLRGGPYALEKCQEYKDSDWLVHQESLSAIGSSCNARFEVAMIQDGQKYGSGGFIARESPFFHIKVNHPAELFSLPSEKVDLFTESTGVGPFSASFGGSVELSDSHARIRVASPALLLTLALNPLARTERGTDLALRLLTSICKTFGRERMGSEVSEAVLILRNGEGATAEALCAAGPDARFRFSRKYFEYARRLLVLGRELQSLKQSRINNVADAGHADAGCVADAASALSSALLRN